MKRGIGTGLVLFFLITVSACNQAQEDQSKMYSPDHGEPYSTKMEQDENSDLYSFDQAVPNDNQSMKQGERDHSDIAKHAQRNGTQMDANDDQNDENKSAQEIAERLTQLATRVDQVNDATAVVVGKYAVVGIDIDANLDRSKVGSIKYSVAEALKDDPMGANAIVTADIDTYHRLQQMAEEIRNGRPLAGVMEELADIVGRLMPQVPREVKQQEANDTPDHPSEQEQENR